MPELPWAPMSDPWAMACATSAREEVPSRAPTTDSMVSVMLVPVSPSGTGYTLSRFSDSRCSWSRARKRFMTCLRSWARMESVATAGSVYGAIWHAPAGLVSFRAVPDKDPSRVVRM